MLSCHALDQRIFQGAGKGLYLSLVDQTQAGGARGLGEKLQEQGNPVSRLILLTYVNRSGSTLLARLLDEYNDVGVTPEARIPDNIIHGPIAVDNLKEIESLLSRLYRDEKFSSWGIDRDVLGQRLSACTMPLKFEELLQVILNEYFGSESVKARIYKCGAYFGEIEAVLSALPQAAVIFVLRDPRAVFNSQRSSRESILQTKMAGNPLDTARSFKRASQIMNQYNGKPFFIVVRYEELVENAAGAVRDLLMTLDLDSGSTGKKAAYVEKIPDRQKHLHSNVAEGAHIRSRFSVATGTIAASYLCDRASHGLDHAGVGIRVLKSSKVNRPCALLLCLSAQALFESRHEARQTIALSHPASENIWERI